MSRISCKSCNGLGGSLVRKSGKLTIKPCQVCKGKGSVIVAKLAKKSKTSKKSRVIEVQRSKKNRVLAEKKSSKHHDHSESKAKGVRVTVTDVHEGTQKTVRMNDEQQLAKETIEDRASFFGCPGKVIDIKKGPVITMYEFQPAKATRIKKLINLQEDLALALSAEAVMVRRIPGRDVMGIEISNDESERQNVAFRASLQFVMKAKKAGMELPLNLGTDPFGEPIVEDLATMPHLLIAGSTGSGKSVSLNCIISSLLTACSPDELEFYMIDPKGVELTHYDGIPHMTTPMVNSPHRAKEMLEHLVREMRRRLEILTYNKVRDLKELNKKFKAEGKVAIPRIVLIIDELGDLMLQDRREFTRLIAEISQIARATGIHMVAATQRPSVDVLSGKIKVNFPGRMAFKVTSMTDSKVIIQRKGAEGLLGRGDMLYQSPTRSAVIRIHAPWVPLEDVKEIAGKLREVEEKKQEEARRKAAELEAKQAREAAALARKVNSELAGNSPRTLRQDERETQPIDFGWMKKS